MEPLYHEEIPAGVAQQLLQDDFVSGANMSYYMIMEMQNTVILQHDNDTGKDVEVTLPLTESPLEERIPKIESYRGEYKSEGLSKFVIIQLIAVSLVVLFAVVGIYMLYNIIR